MRYFLGFIVILILAAVIYAYWLAEPPDPAFLKLEAEQANPFKVSNSKAPEVWARAKFFLEERRALIAGGSLRSSDTVLYIPYANSYKKGSSVRIEQHVQGDSTTFICHWWYSQNEMKKGGKEIALFMEKGINRYHFKHER